MTELPPYELHPDFELVVIFYAITCKKFWSKVGRFLEAEGLADPRAKLILTACRAIAKEAGQGPGSALLVLQRIARHVEDGKVTREELDGCNQLIDDVSDFAVLPSSEEVAREVAPVVARRLRAGAVMTAHEEWAKGSDFTGVTKQLLRASGVGADSVVSGIKLSSDDAFDTIANANIGAKLSTGVVEIDLGLNGGLARAKLGMFIGDSGAGKSQALISQAAQGIRDGLRVGIVTLELPEPVQLARLYANLSGIEVDDIIEVPAKRKQAQQRMQKLRGLVGEGELVEMTPHTSTVRDIDEWVRDRAAENGAPFDLLVVDYADKLAAPGVRAEDSYTAGRYIYEGLRRDLAVAHNMWVWTASQATRPEKQKGKTLDLQHVADSMHKIRAADLVLTLNYDEESMMMSYFVAKNRMGRARFMIGPVATDFARARLSPIVSEPF